MTTSNHGGFLAANIQVIAPAVTDIYIKDITTNILEKDNDKLSEILYIYKRQLTNNVIGKHSYIKYLPQIIIFIGVVLAYLFLIGTTLFTKEIFGYYIYIVNVILAIACGILIQKSYRMAKQYVNSKETLEECIAKQRDIVLSISDRALADEAVVPIDNGKFSISALYDANKIHDMISDTDNKIIKHYITTHFGIMLELGYIVDENTKVTYKTAVTNNQKEVVAKLDELVED